MDYGDTEIEISHWLNSMFEKSNQTEYYEATPMPETEDEFKVFYQKFNKARAAVQYVDSTYQPSSTTGIVIQPETARFRLTFEARKLRGLGGLYQLIKNVKLYLLGFKPSNCEAMTIAKYGLLEFEQNKWQPFLEFECKCTNVQTITEEEPILSTNLSSVITK